MKRLLPVVLKANNPLVDFARAARAGNVIEKCEYHFDPNGLYDRINELHAVGIESLIQELVRGHGVGHMILIRNADVLLRFKHKRIHEWPPEGGMSCLCESRDPDEDSLELGPSIRLLQAIDWDGPAMVEYKKDRETGELCLMEINGRFWGSMPLSYHAGARFAAAVIATLQREPIARRRIRYGIQCKSFSHELRRLLLILFGKVDRRDTQLGFKTWVELAEFISYYFKPTSRFYIFTFKDPLPAFVDFCNVLRSLVRRLRTARQRS